MINLKLDRPHPNLDYLRRKTDSSSLDVDLARDGLYPTHSTCLVYRPAASRAGGVLPVCCLSLPVAGVVKEITGGIDRSQKRQSMFAYRKL